MSRWKGLPAELDPRVRQLVVRLRRLKDHGGLSARQLAAKTGYSTSSWERYLSGRSLPPREAVEAMARVVGEDPTRLLALHELAAEAWTERRGNASEGRAGHVVESVPRPRRSARPWIRTRTAVVVGAVALVLAVSTTVLLVVRLDGNGGEQRAAPSATPSWSMLSPTPSEPSYTCRPQRIDGLWYGGNSRTKEAVLAKGLVGRDVAEAQCLLRRAGYAPGAIDGIYGPLTERAVKQVQRKVGLVVDGIIGPHTWEALRG
ncbi:peptidoglycan-binding protein [Streptomyces sp. YU58]|uniref:peptidoglycan-binding protein n=1 Tax=Streptomyces sp. SX92 TaxID=3158972 RepID=UPI0027BAFF18|nr:peptidoglycan-binding protein [Streptomyces coralus]WLW51362.1 peptidoglycan-binding protein [Streptomyces coralus]